MADPVVIFTTWSCIEAAQLRTELSGADIPCEMLGSQHSVMLLMGGEPALSIRLVVPPSKAEEAVRFIENRDQVQVIGRVGSETGDEPPCLHCGSEMPAGVKKCPHCEFTVKLMDPEAEPTPVAEAHPDAISYCPACRALSIEREGRCPACDQDFLKPVGSDNALCPSKRHVIDGSRAERGILGCAGCKTFWVIPDMGPAQEDAPLCPHCGGAMPPGADKCRQCGFTLKPMDPRAEPTSVVESHPDAKSYCPACRAISVKLEGRCPVCDEDHLKPIGPKDVLCLSKEHVMDASKAKQGILSCAGCETVWILPT